MDKVHTDVCHMRAGAQVVVSHHAVEVHWAGGADIGSDIMDLGDGFEVICEGCSGGFGLFEG